MSLKAKYIILLSFSTLLLTAAMIQMLYQPIPTFSARTPTAIDFNSKQAHEHNQTKSEVDMVKSVKSGAWSDLMIWDSKRVPTFGDNVLISTGTVVTYDVHSQNAIGNLRIDGKLIFSRNKSTNLDVGNIEVSPSGRLEVGTKDNPIPSKYSATIRFVMDTPGQNGLIIKGQAEIHGRLIKNTFTKLASDAMIKGTSLFVQHDVQDWSPGDKIVITATGKGSCTELNTIAIASGRSIILTEPLRCYHGGKEPSRAEVALLTRNVVITSKNPNLKGHTMFMDNAKGGISYAEFVNLGPQNQLGKYPIHFHKMGDASKGMYVQGASIWNSTNRWLTIHSSNGVTLKDNVGYYTVGHGYFLEDGDEVFNIINHNIGILTRKGSLISSDATSAVFWIENPYNRLLNNIAVRGQYYGYKYDVPDRVEDIKVLGGKVNLRSLPILEFDNNEAHDNGAYGLWTSAGARYSAMNQTIPSSMIKNFLSWRNGDSGIFFSGRGTTVTESLFFGNGLANIGFYGDNNTVRNTHVIGEMHNEGSSARIGIAFQTGKNNQVINSTLEKHNLASLHISADIIVGSADAEITGSIVNSKMLSQRTIVFGYPQYSTTHLKVQNYIAPNDNHAKGLTNFTLWRIDNQMNDAKADMYFVALVQRN